MKEPGSDQRRENEMAFDLVGRWASDALPQKCKVVLEPVGIERGERSGLLMREDGPAKF